MRWISWSVAISRPGAPGQAVAIACQVGHRCGRYPDRPLVPVVCHQIGEGPAILHAHGWQAQAADLMPLAQALADARWHLLQGLGHFRILTDPAVHEAAIDACQAPTQTTDVSTPAQERT